MNNMFRYGMWFIFLHGRWQRAGILLERNAHLLIANGMQMIFIEDSLWLPVVSEQRRVPFEYVGLFDLPDEVQNILRAIA